jgi:hypothetical protein
MANVKVENMAPDSDLIVIHVNNVRIEIARSAVDHERVEVSVYDPRKDHLQELVLGEEGSEAHTYYSGFIGREKKKA